ncbi:TPA: sensor histidine kinase [Streptococcus pyogenes]|nr:HAMP domain-containing histidine kinase [Streptococcus pyogenes]
MIYKYLMKECEIEEDAEKKIKAFIDGDMEARIFCDKDGQIYSLFHSVNSLSAILNSRAVNEAQEKEFFRNTISDISHQLKTPLAALNIYNSLISDEANELPNIKDLCIASERELDRVDTLIQNLLKITRLDAGMILMEKTNEDIENMLKDIELHFKYRAQQEGKSLKLSGKNNLNFLCDRDWIIEAISNIIKNALDHTEKGNNIKVEWKEFATMVQIKVSDNGKGIHPEDINHIFKRFYRSRFSNDSNGIGLGLPLAKSIIEAHDGTIEVFSELGKGTTFVLNFFITTKL